MCATDLYSISVFNNESVLNFTKELKKLYIEIFFKIYGDKIRYIHYYFYDMSKCQDINFARSYFEYIKKYKTMHFTYNPSYNYKNYFKYLDILSSKSYTPMILSYISEWIIKILNANKSILDLTDFFWVAKGILGKHVTERSYVIAFGIIEDLLNLYLYLTNEKYVFKSMHYIILKKKDWVDVKTSGKNFFYFAITYLIVIGSTKNENYFTAELFKEILLEGKMESQAIFRLKNNVNDETLFYKRGINVHSTDRDDKTRFAIKTLIENTQEINHDKYYKKFNKYISKLPEDEKAIINKVIYGNNRKSTDFEGFQTILFEKITGEEILAKFWYFAKKYENDKEDLKENVINALLDCYQKTDSGNYVVCNPGKLQRLVVGVLQGRLKDKDDKYIQIDSVEIENLNVTQSEITNYYEIQKKLEPFINLYLYEESTRIKSWEEVYIKLFEFIKNVRDEGIMLSYEHSAYYISVLADNGKGLEIKPDLSIISLFDCDIGKEYVEKFGK